MQNEVDTASFPLIKTVLTLTAIAAVIVVLGVLIIDFRNDIPASYLPPFAAIGVVVWLINVANVSILSRMASAKSSGQTIAMTHFGGTFGRGFVGVAAVLVAVYGFSQPMIPVLVAFAVVYIPLLMVESVAVAKFVKLQLTPDASTGCQG